MPGERKVFLDFIVLLYANGGRGIFLSINDALLQGRIELTEIDRLNRRAQRLKGIDKDFSRRDSYLESLEIGHGFDRTTIVGDAAHADIDPAQEMKPRIIAVGFDL